MSLVTCERSAHRWNGSQSRSTDIRGRSGSLGFIVVFLYDEVRPVKKASRHPMAQCVANLGPRLRLSQPSLSCSCRKHKAVTSAPIYLPIYHLSRKRSQVKVQKVLSSLLGAVILYVLSWEPRPVLWPAERILFVQVGHEIMICKLWTQEQVSWECV